MTMELDRLNSQILRILLTNARRPISEIAAEVGLSPSACHRRIKIMEHQGTIRGYTIATAVDDRDAPRVNILVQVRLERQTEDYMVRFEHAVRQCPEIKECFLMTGDVDYWLRVQTESVDEYEAIHSEILSRLPGVTRINSSVSMRDALIPKKARRHRPR